VRKFLSSKVAQGATGKSTLVVAEALSMASGKPLLGIIPSGRLRTWVWNLEDPKEETERKIQATALHYNLSAADIEGYLFVDSGRDQKLVIAETTRDGAKIIRPVVDSLIQEIIARKIDVLIIDPFISSHRVVENTADMDLVVKQWNEVAELGNCAVVLVHHTRKGELEKTVESARGSGSITDACRSVEVLNRMTPQEAKQAGVKNHRLYFRVYDDKPNLAPPKETSDWYKLQNVDLGNGSLPGGLGGDQVGVAITWLWPDFMAGITGSDFEKVAQVIRGGKFRKSSQAKDWVGKAVGRALNLSVKDDKAKILPPC
jgi:RecA-family ATPase